MTVRRELTPEEIERLLPAYRRLLRAASEKKAVAETPLDGQEKGTAPSNAAPVRDLDLHQPDQRLVSCPPQS
jgi:hypothetical protein